MMTERHLISQDAPMIEALRKLNELSGSAMTLFVIDAGGCMTGTLTDGDIRRGMLSGAGPSDPVSMFMHRDFSALDGNDDIGRMREYRAAGLRLIPRIDADGTITDIVDTAVTRSLLPVDAILMAGGRGERLRPLTLTVPKPLLKVGGRAIIDRNIDALAAVGIKRVRVTVNYLAEQLEEHFRDGVPEGMTVECVREPMPMGTIGSAALIDHRAGGTTLVMNSDLLTSIDLEQLYITHRDSGALITIAAVPYNVSVPYAILETDGQRVTALTEKPSYSFYANAGIYMIENSLLERIPADSRTDATDLIDMVIAEGGRVTYSPINGLWIDIGSPTDFRHACELMEHGQKLMTK